MQQYTYMFIYGKFMDKKEYYEAESLEKAKAEFLEDHPELDPTKDKIQHKRL
jgi:hypothetical protein